MSALDDVGLMLAQVDAQSEIWGRPHPLTRTQLEPLAEAERVQRLHETFELLGALPVGSDLAFTRGRWQLFRASYRTSYTPVDILPLPVVYFAATEQSATHEPGEQQDVTLVQGWAELVPLTVHDIATTHTKLLADPHAQTVAEILSGYLTKVLR